MTTRSGVSYKSKVTSMTESGESVNMAQMLKALLEDRKRREEEWAEERRRREEESRAREAEIREERRRRDEELAKREAETKTQLGLLQSLIEGVQRQSEAAVHKAENDKDVKIAKLTENDDVEAYLTTFERLMLAYEVKREKWAFKLAPQLVGKAQQAYAGLTVADAGDYEKLKSAILRRYDITEDSYRQRFRAMRLRPGESNRELVARLEDLANKWMKTCTSVEELKDVVILEQLLNTLPDDVRIFVKERKPKTSAEAGRLADDYIAARKENAAAVEKEDGKKVLDRRQPLRCGKCRKLGHLARDCRQTLQPRVERETEAQRRPRKDLKDVECYNCHKKGHYSSNCPSNALFCRERPPGKVVEQKTACHGLKRKGTVEGTAVDNILLDTGCSRTLVRQELVPRRRMLEGEAVAIRCAHGDTVLYPLASVQVVVDGRSMEVKAAVSEKLPADVLLGTDVPELPELLNQGSIAGGRVADAMAVVTRAQKRKQQNEEEETQQRELESGVTSTGVEDDEWMAEMDDDLFEGGHERIRQTRSQKRRERQAHARATDVAEDEEQTAPNQEGGLASHPLDISAEELKTLQAADTTLDAVRRAADGHPCSAGVGFFRRDGLLFRTWTPPRRDKQDMSVEQLVLPVQCRRTVLQVAHDIPMSGHLGKEKTAQRILQRFYWPTLYGDVAEYCRTCEVCQKSSRHKLRRAPMQPLPVIEEPFSRIGMDIIGPLPKSRSGSDMC